MLAHTHDSRVSSQVPFVLLQSMYGKGGVMLFQIKLLLDSQKRMDWCENKCGASS